MPNKVNNKEKFEYGLLKTGEEGAEAAQAVLKSVNHSDEFEMVDGNVFFEKLVEEFGDVNASLQFCVENSNDHFRDRILQRTAEKRAKYDQKFAN